MHSNLITWSKVKTLVLKEEVDLKLPRLQLPTGLVKVENNALSRTYKYLVPLRSVSH